MSMRIGSSSRIGERLRECGTKAVGRSPTFTTTTPTQQAAAVALRAALAGALAEAAATSSSRTAVRSLGNCSVKSCTSTLLRVDLCVCKDMCSSSTGSSMKRPAPCFNNCSKDSTGGGLSGTHRVGCLPDIPFVHNQLTTLGRWGHSDVAHRAKETRLADVICSRAHVAVRKQRLQWLALKTYLVNLSRGVIAKVLNVSTVLGGASTAEVESSAVQASALAQAVLQAQLVYYRVLLHILQTLQPCSEVVDGRHKRRVIPNPEETFRILSIPDFHLGLLTCSLELVCQVVVEVSFLFFVEGGGGMCSVGDTSLISSFIATLGDMAAQQTAQLASAVAEAHGLAARDVALACGELMDALLMQRLDLFFNQHSAVLVTCCVYGVTKVLRLSISFKAIIAQAVATLPNVTAATFHTCSLPPPHQASDPKASRPVDIRAFYNTAFLPACDTMIRDVHRSYEAKQAARAQAGGAGLTGGDGSNVESMEEDSEEGQYVQPSQAPGLGLQQLQVVQADEPSAPWVQEMVLDDASDGDGAGTRAGAGAAASDTDDMGDAAAEQAELELAMATSLQQQQGQGQQQGRRSLRSARVLRPLSANVSLERSKPLKFKTVSFQALDQEGAQAQVSQAQVSQAQVQVQVQVSQVQEPGSGPHELQLKAALQSVADTWARTASLASTPAPAQQPQPPLPPPPGQLATAQRASHTTAGPLGAFDAASAAVAGVVLGNGFLPAGLKQGGGEQRGAGRRSGDSSSLRSFR
ncbi:hypothetical protein QJQ45_008487 [Haematococcus lacustris]|nr:hypothetical protein QJQ45_008487 [Haematococcus lacustris]